jgi:hypothetical protein
MMQEEGRGCPRALPSNRIHLVLPGMQNRTLGPYLAAMNRLVSLIFPMSSWVLRHGAL